MIVHEIVFDLWRLGRGGGGASNYAFYTFYPRSSVHCKTASVYQWVYYNTCQEQVRQKGDYLVALIRRHHIRIKVDDNRRQNIV